MNRVSVIIPCYRDAATIARALDSVYRQTHPVEEVIVVNDCSPQEKEVEQVLQAYPRVTYIKNPVNLGLAGARNKGISVASGEVLTFLDADDEWHPQKIEFQTRMLREKSAVACRVLRVTDNERPCASVTYRKVPPVSAVTSSARMVRGNYLTGASIMIARDLMVEMGGYDATLRSCEDYDLWLRLIEAGITVYNVHLPLYIYHINKNGLSNDYKNVSYWELEVLKKYYIRKRNGLFESFGDSCIWAWWMLKHLARNEVIHDEVLRARTVQNIELLSRYPLLMRLLKLTSKSHVLKLYAGLK